MKYNMMTTKIAVATLGLTAFSFSSASAETLKVSHQFSTKDFRHDVMEVFAKSVHDANVDLKIKIYPSKSLVKPKKQYGAIKKKTLDLTFVPLIYAAGIRPQYNLSFMPGLIRNHDHADRIMQSPFMDEMKKIMAKDNVISLVDGYIAGGFAGKDKCFVKPSDIKGLSARGAGKAFDQMLAGAGASVTSMPSSELYSALQTGVIKVLMTSSSSFTSYRIYEQVKCYTPASPQNALFFAYMPLLMSKAKFDKLNSAQQKALVDAGKKAAKMFSVETRKIDAHSVKMFKKAGVKIANMTEADFNEWKKIAQEHSYATFVKNTPDGKRLLDLALSVK